MVTARDWGDGHIKNSLKQTDSNTWLLGRFMLNRSPYPSDTATWNDETDNSSYTLTTAPITKPPQLSQPDSPYISVVHEAGDASVIWAIGSVALCKIRCIEKDVTPESVTLDYVQRQQPNFSTPKVLCHLFDNNRSYLFLQRLPGRTLDRAWPSLIERWRTYYVDTIVAICEEMANWRGERLSGVDGQNVFEPYLLPRGEKDYNKLHATCWEIGMDCPRFVFFHADLGPANIIVEDNPMSGSVGIIDFEQAGFFPPGWIRTKFRVSPGLDLSFATHTPTLWRSNVQKALGERGFKDHAYVYMEWLEKS